MAKRKKRSYTNTKCKNTPVTKCTKGGSAECVKVKGRRFSGPKGKIAWGFHDKVAVCKTRKGFVAVLPGGGRVKLRKKKAR